MIPPCVPWFWYRLTMTRYKQPKKLENLALMRLGDWIAGQAERQMESAAKLAHESISNAQVVLAQNIDVIRFYLDINVPWMVYDSLAVETIRALSDLLEKTKNSLGFGGSMGGWKTADMEGAVQFTDDFMFQILDKNPLIHLRELRILQSDFMTVTSVERILQSCMNLEILVELESWALLTDSDREFIRNFIKINNFNVDTSPIRRYDA
ncbi:unnamed protein product [Parnassius apollo]|uniref:(apollo) hypothetical protein n=1 Tax=Parnassius apollo TaxID=110799 RepID=A0A8S3XF40_PARAO|nr:unnamed protein product [Parnassius apollo]